MCRYIINQSVQFSPSVVSIFVTPWTVARQASMPITSSWSLLKLMSIQPSHPLSSLLLPSVFPSIRVFSNGSVLCIRWSKYWSFSFSISPSNEWQYTQYLLTFIDNLPQLFDIFNSLGKIIGNRIGLFRYKAIWELVMDREAWRASVPAEAKSRTYWAT